MVAPTTKTNPSNYYQTLGVDQKASHDQIVDAYASRLAKIKEKRATLRGDSVGNAKELEALSLEQRRLKEAYDTLRDEKARKDYDKWLKGPQDEPFERKSPVKEAFMGIVNAKEGKAFEAFLMFLISLIEKLVERLKTKKDDTRVKNLMDKLEPFKERLESRLSELRRERGEDRAIANDTELQPIRGSSSHDDDSYSLELPSQPTGMVDAVRAQALQAGETGVDPRIVQQEALASHETMREHVTTQRSGVTNPPPPKAPGLTPAAVAQHERVVSDRRDEQEQVAASDYQPDHKNP